MRVRAGKHTRTNRDTHKEREREREREREAERERKERGRARERDRETERQERQRDRERGRSQLELIPSQGKYGWENSYYLVGGNSRILDAGVELLSTFPLMVAKGTTAVALGL